MHGETNLLQSLHWTFYAATHRISCESQCKHGSQQLMRAPSQYLSAVMAGQKKSRLLFGLHKYMASQSLSSPASKHKTKRICPYSWSWRGRGATPPIQTACTAPAVVVEGGPSTPRKTKVSAHRRARCVSGWGHPASDSLRRPCRPRWGGPGGPLGRTSQTWLCRFCLSHPCATHALTSVEESKP